MQPDPFKVEARNLNKLLKSDIPSHGNVDLESEEESEYEYESTSELNYNSSDIEDHNR